MNKQQNLLFPAALMLIFLAALSRFIPHPPNFTAIGAMAIFGGISISNKKLAFLMPLAALFLSDVALQLFSGTKGFYGTSQLFVYVAFIIITAISTQIQKRSVLNIVLASVWSGAIFFVLSNVGTWASGELYPKTMAGLADCFIAAIPFYQNEFFGNFALNVVYGNLFYCAALFAVYTLVAKSMVSNKVTG